MSYKEIKLRAPDVDSAPTEIMYEIAACRADGVDLLRIDVEPDELRPTDKILSAVIKQLRAMKQKGTVQFFATRDSFRHNRTEAIFLQNKYPGIFAAEITSYGEDYVYVKL